MDLVQAVASMREGDTLNVPAGEYVVPVNTIKLQRGTTLTCDRNAAVKAIPNNLTHYRLIEIAEDNVTVKGGKFVGERKQHKGTDGQWGHVFRISGKGITLDGVTATEAWGDGVYIQGARDVELKNIVSDGNRRQGLSVISVNGLKVTGCTFQNTKGTPPQAGLDLEPDKKEQLVENVTISGCAILNNSGHGITINDRKGPVRNVSISGCTFKGNGKRTINYWGWPWWLELLASAGLYKPTSLKI